MEVESLGSWPAIACSMSAASSTVRVSGPAWSSEEAKAIMPQREQRPYVGFMPTMPQKAPGWRIEPPVSVPVAPRQRPAATAAAEPPELPPGTSGLSSPSPAPGVDDRAVGAGDVGRAHGELVHVGLAQHERARVPEVGGDGGFVRRLEAVEYPGAGLAAHPAGAEEVLDRERDAFEQAPLASREARIGGIRVGARGIEGLGDEGVEIAPGFDGRDMRVGQLARRELPRGEPGAGIRRR